MKSMLEEVDDHSLQSETLLEDLDGQKMEELPPIIRLLYNQRS
jgi:hypothetical protein